MKALPGVLVAGAAALAALGLHTLLPVVPLLTASVLLGMVMGQLPPFQRLAAGVLKPGLGMSAKRFMRIGVVLLGLKLSLVDIAGLGWVTLATTVAIVASTTIGSRPQAGTSWKNGSAVSGFSRTRAAWPR